MKAENLNQLDIFASLDYRETTQILNIMKQENVPADFTLFHEGEDGDLMYIILSGLVVILVHDSDGEEIQVSQAGEGSFFGEMSIIAKDVRSATCRTATDCTLLSLDADSFQHLISQEAGIAAKIMQHILKTSTERLNSTGALVSDMVRWGEDARKRAVTDVATGLYNRGFFDDTLRDRLLEPDACVNLVMLDLDYFGSLNAQYGEDVGDLVILAVAEIFKNTFSEDTIRSRYGGDEFAFIVPDEDEFNVLEICQQLGEKIRRIDLVKNADGSVKKISASIGISVYPQHGNTVQELFNCADKALYASKEAGRDCATLYKPDDSSGKKGLLTSKQLSETADHIIDTISTRNSFLVVSHASPDEDCVGAMVACSLLLLKFSKFPKIVLSQKHWDHFSFLIDICNYNDIEVIGAPQDIGDGYDTVFILDTARTSMIEYRDYIVDLMKFPDVRTVEIDHHIDRGIPYIGDKNYRMVDESSSTCELLIYLALRIRKKRKLCKNKRLKKILTRNFVLAALTGMAGDSHDGQFLKTSRSKRYYRQFKAMLSRKTHINSKNFSSVHHIYEHLNVLNNDEMACYSLFCQHQQNHENIALISLDEKTTDEIRGNYGHEMILSISRYAANMLAEESGCIGVVAYYDPPDISDRIQIRIRRNQDYNKLDLRTLAEYLKIEDGGGHEGAIVLRFPRTQVSNFPEFIHKMVKDIMKLMEN